MDTADCIDATSTSAQRLKPRPRCRHWAGRVNDGRRAGRGAGAAGRDSGHRGHGKVIPRGRSQAGQGDEPGCAVTSDLYTLEVRRSTTCPPRKVRRRGFRALRSQPSPLLVFFKAEWSEVPKLHIFSLPFWPS